jgi:hypothetical protein
MFNKLIDILLVIAIIVCGLTIIFVYEPQSKDLKAKLEKLHSKNDSLFFQISKQDSAIASLQYKSDSLTKKISGKKTKIIYIDRQVDKEKDKISILPTSELVTHFNKKYPKDTTTNLLPIAKPVLVSVAKDLVELDGAKQKLAIQDTIINLTEAKVVLKDDIINKYIIKEDNYKNIIVNKDKEIELYIDENKKIKKRTKLHKVVITGLSAFSVYLLISK